MSDSATQIAQDATDQLAARIFASSLGAMDLLAVYLGDRLGWYRSLASAGPATPDELARRTDTHPRYAREWLEQQAVVGILDVDPAAGGDAATRRYALPPGAAAVLTGEQSLAYLAPLARMIAAAAAQLPALLTAYRQGGGVGWSQFGADARESQADMNRPWFEQALAGALRSVPALDAVLRRPGARIGDVGCGGGWSSIALARAYPDATVDGFDIDAPSIELARANASADIGERLQFHHVDASSIPGGPYDVIFAFECVHDMPRPVEVLAAARGALAPGGSVVVMDEAVADAFTAPGDDMERLMYGFSLFICLPDGMAHPSSAATGTVMRPDTLRRYAADAGLTSFEVLPIEQFGFWRFYRLSE